MAAKVSISIPDPGLLAWAEKRAKAEGSGLSAVFVDALRRARQREARERYLAWADPGGSLTPEREAEIIAEQEGAPPKKRSRRR